jgi:hypothetical protein
LDQHHRLTKRLLPLLLVAHLLLMHLWQDHRHHPEPLDQVIILAHPRQQISLPHKVVVVNLKQVKLKQPVTIKQVLV